jgi:hypothetical protein
VAECLIGMAGVAMAAGKEVWAAQLIGAADATLVRTKMTIWPGNIQAYEEQKAAARARLGEDVFNSSYACGSRAPISLTVEQALSFVAPGGTASQEL